MKKAFENWMNNTLNKKGVKRFQFNTIQYYLKALDIASKEIASYADIFSISDIRVYKIVEREIRNDPEFNKVNYDASKGMKGHLSAALHAYRDFLDQFKIH